MKNYGAFIFDFPKISNFLMTPLILQPFDCGSEPIGWGLKDGRAGNCFRKWDRGSPKK